MENLREEVLSVGNMGSLSVQVKNICVTFQNIISAPQSGDKRRVSSCSGYSTGQASVGSPRRISGASAVSGVVTSDQRRISSSSGVSGYYSDERPSLDGGYNHYKSQHWRYSFRKMSE